MNWDLTIGVAGTLAGALGGVWLGAWWQAKTAAAERQAAYLQQHRDLTTELLGELQVQMINQIASTLGLMDYGANDADEFMESLGETKALLTRLAVAHIGHPSAPVREALGELPGLLATATAHTRQALMAVYDENSSQAKMHKEYAKDAMLGIEKLKQELMRLLHEDQT